MVSKELAKACNGRGNQVVKGGVHFCSLVILKGDAFSDHRRRRHAKRGFLSQGQHQSSPWKILDGYLLNQDGTKSSLALYAGRMTSWTRIRC